ncbi:MAG: NADAR family protein, partial [Sphingobacteriales bacterium]
NQACLSQWWDAPFKADSKQYPTAEHYMMAQKARLFGDEDAYAKTLLAKKPAEVKEIGRTVRNFEPGIWDANKYRIVVEGNYHKFNADKAIRDYLLATKQRVLVEASPVDKIWGIGLAADDERVHNPSAWQGENLLGYALMEVRDLLLKEQAGLQNN